MNDSAKAVRVFDEKKGCTLDTQAGSVPRTITEEPELKARELSKMTTLQVLNNVQLKLEDHSQKKKIMFLHSKNKASRKGYKGEC